MPGWFAHGDYIQHNVDTTALLQGYALEIGCYTVLLVAVELFCFCCVIVQEKVWFEVNGFDDAYED